MLSMWNILAVYAGSIYKKWTHGTCKLNDGDIGIELCLLGIDYVTVMGIRIVQISSLSNTKPNSIYEVPKVYIERSIILIRHRLTVNTWTLWWITWHHHEHMLAERNEHTSKDNLNVFISTNQCTNIYIYIYIYIYITLSIFNSPR